MWTAHMLHYAAGSERWVIEAGVLGKATTQEIAEYVAQPPEVIETYIKMYFDVVEKLNAPGYILSRVLPAQMHNTQQGDYDFLYKTLAFCAGWEIFKDFIGKGRLSERARDFVTDSAGDQFMRLAWAALNTVKVTDNFTAVQLIEQYTKVIMQRAEQGLESGRRNELATVMGRMLEQCKAATIPHKEPLQLDEPRAEIVVPAKLSDNFQPAGAPAK
jgi:hypothetical protein